MLNPLSEIGIIHCANADATFEPRRPAKVPASWEFVAADAYGPALWIEPEAEWVPRLFPDSTEVAE